jgi:hypothetical protein
MNGDTSREIEGSKTEKELNGVIGEALEGQSITSLLIQKK